jgi:cation-transporting ATPase I
VGIIGDGRCACWSADLLCGPGLQDVWRVLQVTAAARPLSERVVHLAQSATALGTLLALVGGKRGGKTHALAPVHSSALVGIFHGTRTASSATRGRAPAPVVHVAWHALDPTEVLERLAEAAADPQEARRVVALGRQVAARVRSVADKPGPRHALAPARVTVGITVAVREELQDPLTPVLALGAAALAVVGSVLDAALVGTVLGGNALISGAQRYHAEQALQKLMVEQTLTAQRLRRTPETRQAAEAAAQDATRALETLEPLASKTVAAPRLVPGDIVVLRATDVVPADARLLVACDLEVDESSLTGESVPVHKDVEATPGARLPDRTCMVFEGTTVLAGTAYAVVVATGDSTEAARASRAAGAAAPAAGVQARLAEVTRLGLPATGIGGVAVAGIGLLRGLPLRESIAAGVSVAVAAVPEGLPLVATMAQAGAARRLSRRGVLVRSSRTLEALGRVDTVCFDKTGTLTEGRLRVSVLATADGEVDDGAPAARRLLEVASRACPAVDDEDIGDVTHAEDRALLEAVVSSEHGVDREAWELRCESPFEATRGYAASLGRDGGDPLLAVKGAPEVLLELCTSVAAGGRDGGDDRPMSEDLRRTAGQTAQQLAEAGLRVLAVAERRSGVPEETEDLASSVCELTLVGFVGIADAPRETAAAAVKAMVDAGIQPVMITGDHPATACAIAQAVGLPAERVVTGDELDGITEQERVSLVSGATVFARVSPEQKVRIVEAFRAADRVVMMTGDGTNDAAAIRLADVGIGVGADASAAARSSADLVLSEPDLPRIHDALLEGRAMWHRMQAAVSILVGGNAGEMAFMTLGTAVAGRAPINIRQMLLVNLLTDMLPALAVAVAPLRDPDQANAPVDSALGASLARAVAVRGTTTALGASLAWTAGRYTGRRRRADTMGLAALVGTQLGQTLMVGWRSPLVVATSLGSAGVMFVIVETPVVSQLFGCTPIGPFAWAVVVGSSAAGTLAAAAAPRVLPAPGTE